MDYLKGMHWRYAVKKMNGTSPDKNKIDILLESVRLTASSYGLQPYRLVIVENPLLKEKLQKASYNQEKVTQASHILIFATVTSINSDFIQRFIAINAKQRKKPIERFEGLQKMISNKVANLSEKKIIAQWATNQAYIALGSALSAAATLGVDTCAMEGFEANKYNEILGLKTIGLSAAVVCAVGLRADDDELQHEPKVRWEPEEFFIHL